MSADSKCCGRVFTRERVRAFDVARSVYLVLRFVTRHVPFWRTRWFSRNEHDTLPHGYVNISSVHREISRGETRRVSSVKERITLIWQIARWHDFEHVSDYPAIPLTMSRLFGRLKNTCSLLAENWCINERLFIWLFILRKTRVEIILWVSYQDLIKILRWQLFFFRKYYYLKKSVYTFEERKRIAFDAE